MQLRVFFLFTFSDRIKKGEFSKGPNKLNKGEHNLNTLNYGLYVGGDLLN